MQYHTLTTLRREKHLLTVLANVLQEIVLGFKLCSIKCGLVAWKNCHLFEIFAINGTITFILVSLF